MGLSLTKCPARRNKGHQAPGPSACPVFPSGTGMYMRLPGCVADSPDPGVPDLISLAPSLHQYMG